MIYGFFKGVRPIQCSEFNEISQIFWIFFGVKKVEKSIIFLRK